MLKLLLVIGCLLPVRLIPAESLPECEGFIISLVPNPNLECSEYVFCDGEDSFYCNGECNEPVSCYGSNETTAQTEPATTPSTTVVTERQTDQPPISSISPLPTTTEKATTTTISSSTATTTTTASSSSSDNLHVICRRSGQDGVYPYPANNNYYYQCLSGYLLLQQCPQHFLFDESLGKCLGSNPYHL